MGRAVTTRFFLRKEAAKKELKQACHRETFPVGRLAFHPLRRMRYQKLLAILRF